MLKGIFNKKNNKKINFNFNLINKKIKMNFYNFNPMPK